MSIWASLGSLFKKPETYGALAQGLGSIFGAKGAGEQQRNQAIEAGQANQIDQYSQDYWGNRTQNQSALNAALSGHDPLQDQFDIYKAQAQSDIRNDPGGAKRSFTAQGPASLPSGRMGQVVSFAPSASTTAKLSNTSLANAQANKYANMSRQSGGQAVIPDLGALFGDTTNADIVALQDALGTQQTADKSAVEGGFNDYLGQIDQAYQSQAQNAGGKPSNAGKWLAGGAAAAAPFLIPWAKSKFKTPTTAQNFGGGNVDQYTQY